MKNTITIAPNPAMEEAVIKYSEMEANCTIELYDLTGRLLEAHPTIETSGSMVLTTSNYPSGIYIDVVRSNGTLVSQQKLVIE